MSTRLIVAACAIAGVAAAAGGLALVIGWYALAISIPVECVLGMVLGRWIADIVGDGE